MKKIVTLLAAFAILSASVFAQVSTEPTDEFYRYVERWEAMRLIPEQPPLRPYALKLVDEILNTVIESEHETEAALAAECYERIHRRAIKIQVAGEGNVNFTKNDIKKQIVGGGHLFGDYAFPKWFTFGYRIGAVATNNTTLDSVPLYTAQPYFFKDAMSKKAIKAFLDMDAAISANYENLYFQAGVNHSSFGPMYNKSAIISPDAKHTANFALMYKGKKISYTQAIFGLSAVSPEYKKTALEELNYNLYGEAPEIPLFSNKFMALHSLNANIFDWLSASFYEVTIYGNRFEPAYLIPAPYMITQGLLGYDDNIFMGVNFTVRPVKNLSWSTDIFLDDLELSQMLKLNLDTKIRGTLQSEIKYVFKDSTWHDTLRIAYTAVTPYMYAHCQKVINPATGVRTLGTLNAVNYQEYTTAGEPLGLAISPNTEKVDLSLSFTPVKRLTITGRGSYSRHANVNESLTPQEMLCYLNSPAGYFLTDGGIHNHQEFFLFGNPIYEGYVPSAWEKFLFLTQPTKMHTIQAGADIDYATPYTKFGRLVISLSYTFEHIINYGVDNPIFISKGGSVDPATGLWVGNATEADIVSSLEQWRSKLCDRTNHYIKVVLKYEW